MHIGSEDIDDIHCFKNSLPLLYYVQFVVNFPRICFKQKNNNNPIFLLLCMICHIQRLLQQVILLPIWSYNPYSGKSGFNIKRTVDTNAVTLVTFNSCSFTSTAVVSRTMWTINQSCFISVTSYIVNYKGIWNLSKSTFQIENDLKM